MQSVNIVRCLLYNTKDLLVLYFFLYLDTRVTQRGAFSVFTLTNSLMNHHLLETKVVLVTG